MSKKFIFSVFVICLITANVNSQVQIEKNKVESRKDQQFILPDEKFREMEEEEEENDEEESSSSDNSSDEEEEDDDEDTEEKNTDEKKSNNVAAMASTNADSSTPKNLVIGILDILVFLRTIGSSYFY